WLKLDTGQSIRSFLTFLGSGAEDQDASLMILRRPSQMAQAEDKSKVVELGFRVIHPPPKAKARYRTVLDRPCVLRHLNPAIEAFAVEKGSHLTYPGQRLG